MAEVPVGTITDPAEAAANDATELEGGMNIGWVVDVHPAPSQ